MQTNPSNVIDALIGVLNINKTRIDNIVREYDGSGRTLTILKGQRKTLPLDAFPCIELEPLSGNSEWTHTRAQTYTCSVNMKLTVNFGTSSDISDAKGVEYIGTLTREIVCLFNNPKNLPLLIPNERSYSPDGSVGDSYIQFGQVSSVTYNASKDFVIRVSEWDWEGKVLESFPPEDYSNPPLTQTTSMIPILPNP